MGDRSKIEWTDASWNPVTGCSHVSSGCDHCYAETLSHRYKWTTKPWGAQHAAENVKLHPERLDQPLRWRRPRRVFVNSMSDLFHERVPSGFIAQVFAVMAAAPQHTFQVLTKRPLRMADYMAELPIRAREALGDRRAEAALEQHSERPVFPLPNVWLGVSVEDQATANERIPLLLKTPAVVRWISAEPLLGALNVSRWLEPACGRCHGTMSVPVDGGGKPCPDCLENQGRGLGLDWVVIGGESGPGARPFEVDWARAILQQCRVAGVPAFVKQMGSRPLAMSPNRGSLKRRNWPEHVRFERYDPDGCAHLCRALLRDRKGGNPAEWPEDLRVRTWPR